MANRPTARKKTVHRRKARSTDASFQDVSSYEFDEQDTADDGQYVADERYYTPRRFSVVRVALVGIAAFLLIAACLFVWNRWWRFDDTVDIQGVWKDSHGSQVVIDDHRLLLANKVIYDYEIDTRAKTISYSYDNEHGQASYRFSGDRRVLVLQEGASTDWLQVVHIKEDTALAGTGELPEGCTRLTRQAGSPQEFFDEFARPKQNSTSMPVLASSSSEDEDGTYDEGETTAEDEASYTDDTSEASDESTDSGEDVSYESQDDGGEDFYDESYAYEDEQ